MENSSKYHAKTDTWSLLVRLKYVKEISRTNFVTTNSSLRNIKIKTLA